MKKFITTAKRIMRTSVIANTIFLSALFAVAVWIIFRVIPHSETRVSVDLSQITSEIDTVVSAEEVELFLPETFGLDINNVEIDYSSMYADSTWAVIDDEEKDVSDEELWFYNFGSGYFRTFSPLEEGKPLNGRVIIKNVSGEQCRLSVRKCANGDSVLSVALPKGSFLYFECDCPFKIETDMSGLVYGDYPGHEYRHVDSLKFYNPINTISFRIEKETMLKVRLCEGCTTTFGEVDFVKSTGTGELLLAYSPRNDSYSVRNQEVSVNYTVPTNAQVMVKEERVSFNSEGSSSEVELSNMKVGLTFETWWTENAYAIPTMLLTVIAGAITLAINGRKREGNS